MQNELSQKDLDTLNRFAQSKGKTFAELIDAFNDVIYQNLKINGFDYYGGRLVQMIRQDILNEAKPQTVSDGWISVEMELPPVRDCDKKSSDGWSLPIIVFNGESVIDDCTMHFKKPDGYLGEKETEYKFFVHAFGYDNDSYVVENVTHWMSLPKAPKQTSNESEENN